MSDGIVVDVIQMPLEIVIITNNMIPESALPEAEVCGNAVSLLEVIGESLLEGSHHLREVATNRPEQKMAVIGKYD